MIWTEKCVDLAWKNLGGELASKEDGSIKIGRGVAAYQQSYGRLTFLHYTSEVWVGVEVDGTVIVRSGVADIGAGQISALGQIAVEILGGSLDDVVIYSSDSAVTPLAGTTTATRALYMTGNATKMAAEALRARLVARAAQAFDVAADAVDLVRLCASEDIHRSKLVNFQAPFSDYLDPETGQGQAHPDYVYGAQAIANAIGVRVFEIPITPEQIVNTLKET